MLLSFQNLVTCASLVTAVKNGWELTEKFKKRQVEQDIEDEVRYKLRRARRAKLISSENLSYWERRIRVAKLDNNRRVSYSC